MDETIAQQVAFRPLGLTKADLQPVLLRPRGPACRRLIAAPAIIGIGTARRWPTF